MDLLEYQGKQYLSRWGVPVPEGRLCLSEEDALQAARSLGLPVVVKAQVRTGGRGKAGGIRLAGSEEEVAVAASEILGLSIRGHVTKRLWVEKALRGAKEHYVSFTLDRSGRGYLAMAAAPGGMDIEEVARQDPKAVITRRLDPNGGFGEADARSLMQEAGVAGEAWEVVERLYACFVEGDCDLVEVNPLGVLPGGRVLAMDAKVILDDNASFRHPEWADFELPGEMDPRELAARQRGLNYIGLEGTVGIVANGAGLAMATLDVVAQVGGRAANFLDVGGGASAQVMTAALEVVDSDPSVRAILVNIFGGITRCDEVAAGILEALEKVSLRSPLVLRLDGTNADQARRMIEPVLSERLRLAPTMLEAARTAVALAG